MTCTCGGPIGGRHEPDCSTHIGDVRARAEAAEVAAAGGWGAARARIREASTAPALSTERHVA